MKNTLDDVVILIPSLDPDEKMPEYVKALIKAKAKHILLVDDGSKLENRHFFDELEKYKEVTILRHMVNQGKGRGLKTGLNYVLEKMPEVKGVVTADADGQHAVDDTIACANRLLETNKVVFGTRNFNEEIVPFKSRNGNKITTAVFKLLYGKLVNDTQTGLRALPMDFIKECLALPGERFEYEIAMLIKIVKDGRDIIEEPIKTIYFESNRATHFNTFKDSYRIYKIMLGTFFRFAITSVLSFIIDWGLYTILIHTIFSNNEYTKGIFLSTVIARVFSSLFNYTVNKNSVFNSKEGTKTTIVKYYILAICQMIASWLLVTVLFGALNINSSILKIFVDFILFIISYNIQNKWVFKDGE